MNAGSEPRGPRFDLERLGTLVQMLAILGAGAWGIYTFIYEAKIKPGQAPPSVSVASTLERVGERGDLVAIRSTVTRTNVGQTGVRVLGLTYNVLGVRMRFVDPAALRPMPAEPPRGSTIEQAAHYEEAGTGEVLLRVGVLFAGATDAPANPSALNPGETVSRDLVFYADRGRLDSIRFLVTLSYAKLSDPPVPLAFASDREGRLTAVPGPACGGDAARCDGLTTTDFATEFSLW